MSAQHTPGPWRVMAGKNSDLIEAQTLGDDWRYIVYCTAHGKGPKAAETNAHRIVACVNACEGLTTEFLASREPGGLVRLIQITQKLIQEKESVDAALDYVEKLCLAVLEKRGGKQ